MAHATHAHEPVRNPGPYSVSSSTRMMFIALAAIGAVALAAGFFTDARRVWFSFLHNHFYFMSIALGGLFFATVQWLTGAMWSAPIRRVTESFTAYLPVALVAFVVLFFGMHDLYVWTHADHVKGDIILEGKAGYLNVPFFFIRNLVFLGVMWFFSKKLIGNSVAQDANGDFSYTARNRSLAPAFMILFGVLFTMASFDQLMSLDPHWFSTMFGVYCFSGAFYAILALTTILVVQLKRNGALQGIVNENHLHDLGKFMFAFTVFWAYIGFSQFLLIWYANLPEETGYFLNRMHNGWFAVSVFLLVGKFMVPFFLLLPRDAKRNEKMLLAVGAFMLIAQWIDMLWIVQPELYREGPRVGWIELGVTALFLGVFGLMVSRFMAKNNIVAIGDPRLAESVHHHHQ